MLPLALLLQARGMEISGSDRALDQSRTQNKFDFLRAQGIRLYPQDGSGLISADQTLIASAAIEASVPDIAAANRIGARRLTRAEALSEIFNDTPLSIGIAGTSGKSTVTGMVAWILHQQGRSPSVMNGAVMKNFVSSNKPYASALAGGADLFVSELDESDESIALFTPTIALVNNISKDHKSLDELHQLFGDYIAKAESAILNLDDLESSRLRDRFPSATTFSVKSDKAHYYATDITPYPAKIEFTAHCRISGKAHPISLPTPGAHNVANALAAIAVTTAAQVAFADAAAALCEFVGIARRFDIIGQTKDILVIDDFGHNPDKIAATLRALHDFDGRLLVLFQPHGFGPLKQLRQEFTDCFATYLNPHDKLYLPEPVYFGGTVDRAVSSADLAADIQHRGKTALACSDREACATHILRDATPGDRIIIMGARDDTLSDFAASLLQAIKQRI